MKENKPFIPWDKKWDETWDRLSEISRIDVIWWCCLDNRYHIEVRRADCYYSKLYIFDHDNGDALLTTLNAPSLFADVFGASEENIEKWTRMAADFLGIEINPKFVII